MIVVHIDTTSDGHNLTHCYEGIEDAIVLVNPTKTDVVKALEEHPNDTLMGLGHGSPNGLFGTNWGMAIDITMADLLVGRECIFIWCHAKDFAKKIKGFKGFATSMFISNPSEASCFRMKEVLEETTQAENIFFSDRVCDLIKRNVPLNEWVDILRTDYHKEYDFSVFNMEGEENEGGIEYFDGTQEVARGFSKADLEDLWGEEYKERRSTKSIVDEMGSKVDDLHTLLLELRYKMGFDNELEYDGTTITKEDLDRWEDSIEEMETFCFF